MITTEMKTAIETLIESIKADFVAKKFDPKFLGEISISPGKKYIKVIREGSVWGFIVNVDDDAKFKYGDILKPAGWKAPARNAARGNLFTGYNINWTGPHYLK